MRVRDLRSAILLAVAITIAVSLCGYNNLVSEAVVFEKYDQENGLWLGVTCGLSNSSLRSFYNSYDKYLEIRKTAEGPLISKIYLDQDDLFMDCISGPQAVESLELVRSRSNRSEGIVKVTFKGGNISPISVPVYLDGF